MPATLQSLPKSSSITPGTGVVLSIYPVELISATPHAGMFKYIHPPANRDKIITLECNPLRTTVYPPEDAPPYNYTEEATEQDWGFTQIVVHDSYQLTRDWAQDVESYVKRDIPAASIVKSLVQEWASGRMTDSAAGGPGIRAFVPSISLEEQLEEMRNNQTIYFRELVFQADKFYDSKQWDQITNLHRIAAGWLREESRPWYNPIKGQRMKTCPACGESMNLMAIVCKSCSTNIFTFAKTMKDLGVDINDPVLNFYKQEQALPQKVRKAGDSPKGE